MLEKYFELLEKAVQGVHCQESTAKANLRKLDLQDLKALHFEAKSYLEKARAERKEKELFNKQIDESIESIKSQLKELPEKFINALSKEEEIECEFQSSELKLQISKLQSEKQNLYAYADAHADQTGFFGSSWPPSKLDISAWLVFQTQNLIQSKFSV